MPTQTTAAGTYLRTDLYYSYEALWAYENTYAHGDHAGYLTGSSVPVITIRAYDSFAHVLKGYTLSNDYARRAFDTFYEDWTGNTAVSAGTRVDPVKIQFSVLLFANQTASLSEWQSLKYNSEGTGTAPLAFEAGSVSVFDTPANFITAYSNGTFSSLSSWLNGKSGNPVYEIADPSGTSIMTPSQATDLSTALPNISVKSGTTAIVKDSAANLANFINGAASEEILGAGIKIALTDGSGPISATQAAVLLREQDSFATGHTIQIQDTPEAIGLNLDAIKAGLSKITSILVNGEIPLTYSQFLSSADVFAKFSGPYSFKVQGVSVSNVAAINANATVSEIEVRDSAGVVESGLSGLRSAEAKISAIDLTDAGSATISLSVAQLNENAAILNTLVNNQVLDVSGSSAQVSAYLSQLGTLSDQIYRVVLSDLSVPVDLNAQELTTHELAIQKISGAYRLAITDQASAVSDNLDSLNDNITNIDSITISDIDDEPIVIQYAQRNAFNNLATKIDWPNDGQWEGRVILVEGVTLAQAQDIANLSVSGKYKVKVGIVDTAVNLENGAALLASLSVNQESVASIETSDQATTIDYEVYRLVQNFSGNGFKLSRVAAANALATLADSDVHEISVLDSAANISTHLSSLVGQENKIRSITLTNASDAIAIEVPTNSSAVTTLNEYRALTNKFSQSYGLTLSGVSIYDLEQTLRDNSDVVGIDVIGRSDTISAVLSTLDAAGSRVSTITMTDANATVVIDHAKLSNYSDTLDKLIGTFSYRFSDSYTSLVAALPALEALGASLGAITPYGSDYITISRSDFERYESTLVKVNNGTRFYVQGYTAQQAETHALDALVWGVQVTDTAANLSARIDALQTIANQRSTFYPISISQSDAGMPLILTAAQSADYQRILSLFATSVSIEVQDSGANIGLRLTDLGSEADRLVAIRVVDGATQPLSLTASQYNSSGALLSKLVGNYSIKLTEVTVNQAITLSSDARFSEFQLWDNVTNIGNSLDQLLAMGLKLGAVRYTHSHLLPLEVDASRLDAYASVLAKFTDGYVINVTRAPAALAAGFLASANINTITVVDTPDNIVSNLDGLAANSGRITYVGLTGSPVMNISASLAEQQYGFIYYRIVENAPDAFSMNITDATISQAGWLRNFYRDASFQIVDSAFQISGNFYQILALGDALSGVVLTGGANSLQLTASEAAQFAELRTKFESDVTVRVSDAAFNIQQSFSGLIALGDRLESIDISGSAVSVNLSIDQFLLSDKVLSLLTVPYDLSIFGVSNRIDDSFEKIYSYRDKITSVFVDYQDNTDFTWTVDQVHRYGDMLSRVLNVSGINVVDTASRLNGLDLSILGSRKIVFTPTSLDSDITLATNGSVHGIDLSQLPGASYQTSALNNGSGSLIQITQNGVTRTITLNGEPFSELLVVGVGGIDAGSLEGEGQSSATFAIPVENIDAIGLSPDGRFLIIKASGLSRMVNLDSMIEFSNATLTGEQISAQIAPTPVFASVVNGTTQYVLPDLFTGPASLGLKYQLIDTTQNAVVTGSDENDFIKVADGNSVGKAVNGGGGNDVIDGGVGSTFITGGGGSNIFFLDGRASGVSWSTITDFRLGQDKVTIWGWKQGVSKVALVDNFGGAPGYDGLTLHFENLLPSDASEGAINSRWNSITLTNRSLSDLGASSIDELNAQILSGSNPYLFTSQTVDDFGTHGYLHIA